MNSPDQLYNFFENYSKTMCTFIKDKITLIIGGNSGTYHMNDFITKKI
jgi:hypothetical protein